MSDEVPTVLDAVPTPAERRDYRFRIAGDAVEALKVVLAELPADER